jgi:peptidyl-prolyl cis-trans isomerase B (cyclophilin B)
MKMQLFPDVAPNSVNNMIQLIEDGYYDGLIFHRVIENFVIQGGWGELMGKDPASCTIAGEFTSNGFNNDLLHDRGVLSMARTNVPDSATSQFFVMHQKTPSLDGQYAGFGGLIEGFDVLDAIATTATGFQDQPNENIVMERVTVELNGYTPSAPDCVN